MAQHRDPTTRTGCGVRASVAAAALVVAGAGVAVAVASGPAALAEEPLRARVCTSTPAGCVPGDPVGPPARPRVAPEVPRG